MSGVGGGGDQKGGGGTGGTDPDRGDAWSVDGMPAAGTAILGAAGGVDACRCHDAPFPAASAADTGRCGTEGGGVDVRPSVAAGGGALEGNGTDVRPPAVAVGAAGVACALPQKGQWPTACGSVSPQALHGLGVDGI